MNRGIVLLYSSLLFVSVGYVCSSAERVYPAATSFPPQILPSSQSVEPLWWQHTTIYQIYPRSFQDSNGDGIGDIQGIISRLDYLQELGVETLWFSPMYASPQRDIGYDISDYEAIAPEYGTMRDVERLIGEVHRRGMKVVFDMVLNHTSDQHPWFRESRQNRTNTKADWYIWRDGRGANGLEPPNNWQSLIGEQGWHYAKERRQWFFASYLAFQPDLNYRNTAVKNVMFDVVRFWLRKGVDGFRLDMVNVIMKDTEFRDNPFSLNPFPSLENPGGNFQFRQYSANHPDNYTFVQELRRVVDEFSSPQRCLVGEVFGKHDVLKRYLGDGDKKNDKNDKEKSREGLHLIFLFDMLFFDFNADFFRKQIVNYEEHYPAPLVPTLVFSNHDQKRSIGKIGNSLNRAKLLALYQLTARGVPTLYQGEEIGMTNAQMPAEKALDPMSARYTWLPAWLERQFPVLINRDNCRTPMQWSTAPNAGFMPLVLPTFDKSGTKPWLPVNADYKERNVETQQKQSFSLFSTYKQLLTLRKQHPALQSGQIHLLTEGIPSDVLAFERIGQGESVTVLINFSDRIRIVNNIIGEQILTTHPSMSIQNRAVTMPPVSGMVLTHTAPASDIIR